MVVRGTINTKQLRAALPSVVRRVRRGERITVLYRSRPAFQIVPVDDSGSQAAPLEEDSLYGAESVGRSRDGRRASEHDAMLYGA